MSVYAMARDLDTRLQARKYPIRVVYGPERTVREGWDPVIIIERDRGGSDKIGPPLGNQRNPRKLFTRSLAVSVLIFAKSSLAGAMVHDHERDCEALVDAVLVSLYEWFTAERAGALAITSARYLPVDVETWPGVVYEIKFALPRGVVALDWEGAAKPEAPAPAAIVNAFRVSIDGENFENVP